MDKGTFSDKNATEHDANETSDAKHIALYRSKNLVIAFIALYVLLALLVIAGNTLVVVAFRKVPLRTAINMFFVSLAISDLLVGAVSIPLWMYNLSCPHFTSCKTPNIPVNEFYQGFDVFSALASISNLVAISIERYLAICWPVQHRISSFMRYYSMIFATWGYSLIVTVVYSMNLSSSWKTKNYRGSLVFAAGFVVPLIIIIAMYVSIYQSVRDMNAHWKRTNARASALQRSVQREKRTAKTVGIVTALFVVAWLPFFVVSLLWSFHRQRLPVGGGFVHLMDFIKWMHYSNSAVNPVVYAYRSEEIRRMLAKLVTRVMGREEETPRVVRPGNRYT